MPRRKTAYQKLTAASRKKAWDRSPKGTKKFSGGFSHHQRKKK